jgi:hypothetical protein
MIKQTRKKWLKLFKYAEGATCKECGYNNPYIDPDPNYKCRQCRKREEIWGGKAEEPKAEAPKAKSEEPKKDDTLAPFDPYRFIKQMRGAMSKDGFFVAPRSGPELFHHSPLPDMTGATFSAEVNKQLTLQDFKDIYNKYIVPTFGAPSHVAHGSHFYLRAEAMWGNYPNPTNAPKKVAVRIVFESRNQATGLEIKFVWRDTTYPIPPAAGCTQAKKNTAIYCSAHF